MSRCQICPADLQRGRITALAHWDADAAADAVRAALSSGTTLADLAREFGVSPSWLADHAIGVSSQRHTHRVWRS